MWPQAPIWAGDLNSGVSDPSLHPQPLEDPIAAPAVGSPPLPSRHSLQGSLIYSEHTVGPCDGWYQVSSDDQARPYTALEGIAVCSGTQTHPQTMLMQSVGWGGPEWVLEPAWRSGRASWRRRHHSWSRKELEENSRQREQYMQSHRVEKSPECFQAQI